MKKQWLFLFIMVPILMLIHPKGIEAKNKLQDIIDDSQAGSVIKLEDRTYNGNIVINKPIQLVGTNKTIIKGDGTGNVIAVRSPNVILRNFTVKNSSMDRNSAEEYAGIKVHTNGNKLENITIEDSYHGVYLSQAHENTISKIHINGNGKNEIASQGNGIHVYYSNNNKLTKNVIEETRDGMFFDYADGNTIDGNTIRHTRYGLHYMYSNQNEFKNNIFTLNTGGAAIMNSNSISLSNNQFIFNYGHRSFGLLLLSANDITVKDNLFFLNQRGLYIDQSTNNKINQNHIVKNQIGIELWASSNDQIFSENKIAENTIPAVTLGGEGKNTWHDNKKGNDWGSSFPLVDLDQNKIGDAPVSYQSSLHKLIEDQELTYLFLKSPAIHGYEKMNQLLDKEKLMFSDPYPVVGQGSAIPWGYIIAGLVIFVISLKGRHLLCITFGRNGRKI